MLDGITTAVLVSVRQEYHEGSECMGVSLEAIRSLDFEGDTYVDSGHTSIFLYPYNRAM